MEQFHGLMLGSMKVVADFLLGVSHTVVLRMAQFQRASMEVVEGVLLGKEKFHCLMLKGKHCLIVLICCLLCDGWVLQGESPWQSSLKLRIG